MRLAGAPDRKAEMVVQRVQRPGDFLRAGVVVVDLNRDAKTRPPRSVALGFENVHGSRNCGKGFCEVGDAHAQVELRMASSRHRLSGIGVTCDAV